MIFGCDPASKKVALFSSDGATFATFKVPRTQRDQELRLLRHYLEKFFEEYPPTAIFCEEPVLAGVRNIRSTILIAETVGMILALGHSTYLVPVSSWKKATTGSGAASKDRVSEWLAQTHPSYSSHCGDDQDLKDAAAISIYGGQIVGQHRHGADH